MKRFLLICVLFIPLVAGGQVAVSAVVTDPNGVPYSNGSARATLVDANGIDLTNVVVNVNGASIALPAQSKGLSATGAMAFSLYPNTQISYTSSTSWKFSICSPPSTGGISPPQTCFSSTISISGATDISATLKSASVALVGALSGGLKFPDGTVQYTANNSGTVSGQASGVIPLPSAANAITLQSHLDDGVTKASTLTSSESVNLPSSIASGLPMLDIRHPSFGAKCDNSTDDTAALQAAINVVCSTGGTILIPGTHGTACYFANPTALTWCNSLGQLITLIPQGSMRTGTMFLQPPNVDVVGNAGGNNTQFLAGGQQANFQGPTTLTTLGTNVSTGLQTFTPGSTAGMAVNGYLSVANGQLACTVTNGTAASNLVTFQLTGACHIPSGFNAVIAGTTDSNSNGTFLISQDDEFNNTLTIHCTLCVSSTGGTITGPNQDTMENVEITACSPVSNGVCQGGTVTAYFSYAHSSTDTVGTVGYQIFGGNHHEMKNMNLASAGGTSLLIGGTVPTCCGDTTDNVLITNSAANGGSAITAGAIEINNAVDVTLDKVVASVTNGYAGWGLRITNPLLIVGSTGGSGLITMHDPKIRGGIYIDNYTICCGLTVEDGISEETRRGAITVRPNASGGAVYGNKIDNFFIQDNFHFYSLSELYYTQPLGIQTYWTIGNNQSGTGAGAYTMINANFDGNVTSTGAMQPAANMIPSTFNGRVPTILRGSPVDLDMESRQEGASGISGIPFSTQAVPQSPSSWSGTNCSVAPGADRWGGTSAGTITQSGGSNPFLTLFTYVATTPVVGDYILYGALIKGAQNTGSIQLGNSFQQQLTYDAPNIGNFDSSYGLNDEWHAVVALSKVTGIGAGASHPTLIVQCSSSDTIAWPFMAYVPASAGVSQQNLMLWRKNDYHGAVPSSWSRPGVSATALPFAAANFSPTTIYSAGGTPLPTCNAANALIHAAVSDAPTGSLTPGTAYASGGGTIKVWEQCAYSGSAYAWQSM